MEQERRVNIDEELQATSELTNFLIQVIKFFVSDHHSSILFVSCFLGFALKTNPLPSHCWSKLVTLVIAILSEMSMCLQHLAATAWTALPAAACNHVYRSMTLCAPHT